MRRRGEESGQGFNRACSDRRDCRFLINNIFTSRGT